MFRKKTIYFDWELRAAWLTKYARNKIKLSYDFRG